MYAIIWFMILLLPIFLAWFMDKRTLWYGFLFMSSLGVSYLLLLIFAIDNEQVWLTVPLGIIGMVLLLGFLLAPFITFISFLYSGIMVIRREGFRLVNCLALGGALGIAFYLIVWPMFARTFGWSFFNRLYVYIGLAVFYLVCLISAYAITNVLNFTHIIRKQYDYVVVLGAGLNGTEVTPLLASRINQAIKVYLRSPEQTKLIMSGGQGPDEVIPEGVAMANYALKQGVPSEALIIEDKSRNTEENLAFSRSLMRGEKPKFAIVTNYYHVLRALLLAKRAGYACDGYGAKTKLYFSINAFLREFVGYLVMTAKLHLTVFLIFGGIFVLIELISLFIQ